MLNNKERRIQYISVPLVAISFAAASSRAHSPAIMSRQRSSLLVGTGHELQSAP
jgi:hypothetical protein